MTSKTTAPVRPGDTIHVLAPLTIPTQVGATPDGAALSRGSVVTLTAAIIDAGKDRDGRSWLDLLDDEDGQVRRWGKRMFARGPWPEGAETWTPGAPDWVMARDQARSEAWAITNPEARQAALRMVDRRFGPAAGTSQTLGQLDGGRDVA